MSQSAPNNDLLSTHAGAHADRIRAASAAGFTSIQLRTHSGKDMNALRGVIDETAVRTQQKLTEPRAQFVIADAIRCPRIADVPGRGQRGSGLR